MLAQLIPEYQALMLKETSGKLAGSLDNLIDVEDKTSIAARSEEVINLCAASCKDTPHHRKRTLSDGLLFSFNFSFV